MIIIDSRLRQEGKPIISGRSKNHVNFIAIRQSSSFHIHVFVGMSERRIWRIEKAEKYSFSYLCELFTYFSDFFPVSPKDIGKIGGDHSILKITKEGRRCNLFFTFRNGHYIT